MNNVIFSSKVSNNIDLRIPKLFIPLVLLDNLFLSKLFVVLKFSLGCRAKTVLRISLSSKENDRASLVNAYTVRVASVNAKRMFAFVAKFSTKNLLLQKIHL